MNLLHKMLKEANRGKKQRIKKRIDKLEGKKPEEVKKPENQP